MEITVDEWMEEKLIWIGVCGFCSFVSFCSGMLI